MAFGRHRDKNAKISRKRIVAKLIMDSAAVLLSASLATEVLAAGTSATATHGHAHVPKGPLFNQAPSMLPPVLNPSTPYTVPSTPEVPVSPASPGSVFGNGTTGR
jgi:hypothetical protein